MNRLCLIALVVATGCPAPKPVVEPSKVTIENKDKPVEPTTPPGLIPPQPTLRLPRNFVPTSNEVRLALDPAKDDFSGSIAIVGNVAERSSTIWLNSTRLTIKSAVATAGHPFDSRKPKDTQLTATQHGDDWLELRSSEPLEPGAWTIAIEFAGKLDKVNTAGAFKQVVGKDSYIYSQLEAVYARRVFPCFDEPDVKVPWKLTLDVPRALVAVSNTPITAEGPFGEDGKTKRVEFAQTKPLPSYLVAFGVGPFAVVDAGKTKRGTPVRIFALNNRASDAAWAAKSTAQILEISEEWFAIPYPYEKLDMVTIPLTVGFSAMENAGMITMTERQILLNPQASKNQQRIYVVVAAHEIAHQWFGDLVTMQWWDDLWLNEGFATWLEHKTSAKFDPSWHDEGNDVDTHAEALAADSLVSARKIRQPIASTDDIFTSFDGITYSKGATVLDMFEAFVGRDAMQKGVRAYLEGKAFGNATSSDLIASIGTAAGKDLTAMWASFLDHAGAPEVTMTIDCTKGKPATLALSQKRYVPPGAPAVGAEEPFAIPMCVAYDKSGKRAETCAVFDKPLGSIPLESKACPRWVMPNVGSRGYFRVAYTNAQLASLRDEAWPQLTVAERRGLVFDANASAAIARVPIALALSFVPKLLAGADRFTVSDAIGVPHGFDRHVPDELRGKYEQWLRTTFEPGATAVGFLPKSSDTLDDEQTRAELIATVAWTGRDPKLVDEAVKLAEKWQELPGSIRGLVLKIAVDAKPEMFARAMKEIYTEADLGKRGDLIGALSSTRDAKQHDRALELLLDPKLDLRETGEILWGSSTRAMRTATQAFFKKNDAALMKRMPEDGTAGPPAILAYIFTTSCDPGRRDEIVGYVTEKFGKLAGGERTIRQAIEEMDQCIAERKLIEPEIRGWLTGVKIPKPPKTKH